MSIMSTDNLEHLFPDDPYISSRRVRYPHPSFNRCAKPDKPASQHKQYPKSMSQSMPFGLTHNIFVAIPNAEIDSQANRDYIVIQLDYFPHSPLASMSRSQLYKAARKP